MKKIGSLFLLLLPVIALAKSNPFAIFSKTQEVFGVKVYATHLVSDEAFNHAASILKQYLDNDGDGKPDNAKVIAKLGENKASLVIFSHQDSSLSQKFFREFENSGLEDSVIVQDLYQSEIVIPNGRNGQFDASLEEVLHLVTQAGFSQAYPQELGEYPGSELALAMDKARGGHYKKVPNRYPLNAWYTYYDRTCDYSCQVTEYFYWLLTSTLSEQGFGQDFPGRAQDIASEWRPNTHERVEVQDKAGYQLMINKKFHLPTQLPR